MKKMRAVLTGLMVATSLSGCMVPAMYPIPQAQAQKKQNNFEQLDLKRMIDLYVNKQNSSESSIEGIYTVSSVVTKKGKPLFANEEREIVKDRDENYAKVALIRDPGNPNRGYMEISLNKDGQSTFSIIGEFTHLAEGNLLVYKHFESRGKSTTSYTFSYDESRDLLEGIRTDNIGKSTITYQLTYLKVSTKSYLAGQ
jgi:hypothetical protein